MMRHAIGVDPVVFTDVDDPGRPIPQPLIEPLRIRIVVGHSHCEKPAAALPRPALEVTDQCGANAVPLMLRPHLQVTDLHGVRMRRSPRGTVIPAPPDDRGAKRFAVSPCHQVVRCTVRRVCGMSLMDAAGQRPTHSQDLQISSGTGPDIHRVSMPARPEPKNPGDAGIDQQTVGENSSASAYNRMPRRDAVPGRASTPRRGIWRVHNAVNSGPRGDRTHDPRIKSPMLCQLS